MLNREFSVRTWQIFLVAACQLLCAVAIAAWALSKYDSRLIAVEFGVAKEQGINVVQGEQIKAIEGTRFKDVDGVRLTELTISNRERISVIESDMRHIKEDVSAVRSGQADIIALLRQK